MVVFFEPEKINCLAQKTVAFEKITNNFLYMKNMYKVVLQLCLEQKVAVRSNGN